MITISEPDDDQFINLLINSSVKINVRKYWKMYIKNSPNPK